MSLPGITTIWKLIRHLFIREKINTQIVHAFSRAIEYKDEYTMGHSMRVAKIAVKIAKQMKVPKNDIGKIFIAGLLHDIGKIGVRESILQKPGPLTEEERVEIQKHVLLGVNILNNIEGFEDIIQIIEDHHERWDGSGYPKGKKGRNICLGGSIIAAADTYDAMTSKRIYRTPVSKEEACKELVRCSECQFNPEVIEVFVKVICDE